MPEKNVTERANFRQRLTWMAHLFKALTRQHHLPLMPLLRQHIPADAVVLDVGAHAGQFTKLFAKLAPQGSVYAFEPGSYARSIVKKVIMLHGLRNVSLMSFGLSDKPTTETLHVPVKESGSIGFGLSHLGMNAQTDTRQTREEKIQLLTVDDFVAQEKLTRVDFIKADIEGWELRMLQGARATLEKFHPVLMLEVDDVFLKRAGDDAQKMWDFLRGLGYTLSRYDENGRIDALEQPVMKGDVICVFRG